MRTSYYDNKDDVYGDTMTTNGGVQVDNMTTMMKTMMIRIRHLPAHAYRCPMSPCIREPPPQRTSCMPVAVYPDRPDVDCAPVLATPADRSVLGRWPHPQAGTYTCRHSASSRRQTSCSWERPRPNTYGLSPLLIRIYGSEIDCSVYVIGFNWWLVDKEAIGLSRVQQFVIYV